MSLSDTKNQTINFFQISMILAHSIRMLCLFIPLFFIFMHNSKKTNTKEIFKTFVALV
jgi:hypothetical protein